MYKTIVLLTSVIFSNLAFAGTDFGDPTRPYNHNHKDETRAFALQSLQLSSIINSKGRKIAIINNHPYQIGEEVLRNYRVVEIERNFVVLMGPDGRFNLNFPLLDKTSIGVDKKVGDKS